ncbi:MAG: hypothetical protein KGO81_09115 [Bacteroidota bacterium]|nr:hypothetical protein [Bacteroidota bacterium]
MACTRSLAIIGAASVWGSNISRALAAANYRLLLMDEASFHQELLLLFNALMQSNISLNADLITCSKEASWEADIILLVVDARKEKDWIGKMKEVVTQKIIINISAEEKMDNELQQLLPYAKIVQVVAEEKADGNLVFKIVQPETYDQEVLNTATHLVTQMNV